jgi:hypothetical protein
MLTIKLRYKKPDANTSQLMELPVQDALLPGKHVSQLPVFGGCCRIWIVVAAVPIPAKQQLQPVRSLANRRWVQTRTATERSSYNW